MTQVMKVEKIGFLARVADILMVPIMYLLSGTLRESPQKTHAWNVQSLTKKQAESLDTKKMAHCKGVRAIKRWWFLFHIPFLGGWKNYVVLHPSYYETWYVGWKVSGVIQVSKVPLEGPVRMLIGSEDVSFFGISEDGEQNPIIIIGEGRIGDRGPHSKVQLC